MQLPAPLLGFGQLMFRYHGGQFHHAFQKHILGLLLLRRSLGQGPDPLEKLLVFCIEFGHDIAACRFVQEFFQHVEALDNRLLEFFVKNNRTLANIIEGVFYRVGEGLNHI